MKLPQLVYLIHEFLSGPLAMLESRVEALKAVRSAIMAGTIAEEAEIEAKIGSNQPVSRQSRGGAVAVVPVTGSIVGRLDIITALFGGTGLDMLSREIQALVDDPSVSSIVLDVNSPGGQVAGMAEFAAKMREWSAKKPIISVANSTMASAAYWIASQTSEIVAAPSALVGSIGVLSVHQEQSKKDATDGITTTIVRSSPDKMAENPFEPLSPGAKAEIQAKVDYFAQLFRADVAAGRGVSGGKIRDTFGAKVFTAPDAVANGMADRVATLEEVINGLAAGRMPGGSARAEIAVDEGRTSMDMPIAADAPVDVTTLTADQVEIERRKLTLRSMEHDPLPIDTGAGLAEVSRRRLALRALELDEL